MSSDTSNPSIPAGRIYSDTALHLIDPLAPNTLLQLFPEVKNVYIQVAPGAIPPKVVMMQDGEQTVLHDPAIPTEKK